MTPPLSCICRLRFSTAGTQAAAFALKLEDPAPGWLTGEFIPLATPPPPGPPDPAASLEVLALPPELKDDPAWREGLRLWLSDPGQPSLQSADSGDLHVSWRPGRAVITAPASAVPAALESLAEFAHFEGELRRVEHEIAAAWPSVEADTPFACAVASSNRARLAEVGRHMQEVLRTRVRYARIDPRLHGAPAHLPPQARAIGERLRHAARCSERSEAADGQMESQEFIYELASQRIGDSRHARQASVLEISIIVLLVAEVALMLWNHV